MNMNKTIIVTEIPETGKTTARALIALNVEGKREEAAREILRAHGVT